MNLGPTEAGIWGIKSVPEDFCLVQRLSKKITVLYFDSLRKAGDSWALLPCADSCDLWASFQGKSLSARQLLDCAWAELAG